jgi:hypothetical protein
MMEASAEPYAVSHMDRLPDSIVLDIIVRSAKYQPGVYEFYQGRLFGCVQPLCRKRMVSKRFKALVSQTESIAWDFQGQEEMEARAIRFMSAAERIRGLKLKNIEFGTHYHLSIGFLAGVVALTPALTIFELSGFRLGVKAILSTKPLFSCMRHLLLRRLLMREHTSYLSCCHSMLT